MTDVPPSGRIRLLASYAAAALLLWLFLRGADGRVLADGLSSVDWALLGAAVVLRLASLVASSLRWQALLSPVRHLPIGPIVVAMMMGMTVSTVVSMQAAEVARPYFLSRQQGLDFSATFATVAVEWCIDLLSVLVLVIPALLGLRAVGAAQVGMSPSLLASELVLAFLLSTAGLVALGLLPRHIDRIERWALATRLVPKSLRARVADHVHLFASGLGILRRPKGLAVVSGYALLASLLTGLSAWLALVAFGLPLSLLSGFIVLGLITVGGMVPTPGAVGGFHAVCQLGLVTFFTIDRASTVLPVIGLHAVLFAPPAAIGALCLLWVRYQPEQVTT